MKLGEFFAYVLGQFMGSFSAAGFIYCIYYQKFISIKAFDDFKFAGVFATYPNPDVGVFTCFLDQICTTALFIIFILALADKKNESFSHASKAIMVALTVIAIGCSLSFNCGSPINPARDLSPRIFSAFIWGWEPFTAGGYYFWVPVIGPMIGSFIGTLIYLLAISNS
jgi:aquaporin-9